MRLVKSYITEPSKAGVSHYFFYDKVDGFLYVHYLGMFNQYYLGKLR